MKDLFEIASGKRFRKNKLIEAVNSDAVERYRSIEGTKAERSLPLALITVVPETTVKFSEIGFKGKKPSDENYGDLTLFLAWLLPEYACNANPDFASSNKTTRDAIHARAETVYPANAATKAAIKRFKTNSEILSRITNDESLILQYTHERWNICNYLLGLPSIDALFPNMYEIVKYGLALDRAVEYGVNYFSEFYTYLRHNPDAMN